jgi:hypothetical protein
MFEAISDTADIGRVACHSAILRATPRHISGLRKSSGEHTFPSINLYNRPFSNRASNVGASLYLASREWEAASPVEVAVSIHSFGQGVELHTITINQDLSTTTICPQQYSLLLDLTV